MKKYLLIVNLIIFGLCLIVSCNKDGSGGDLEELKAENQRQAQMLQEYQQAVKLLNETVDSIAVQEDLIFVSNTEGPATVDDVKVNLERYDKVLKAQSLKIEYLEKQMKINNEPTEETLTLISNLKQEIASKNMKIAALQNELNQKNVDIAALRDQVSQQQSTINSQSVTIQQLDERTKKQGEALARQDAILNNGYVLIGTKDDLSRKGIIKKGKVVADAALDRSKFAKVDIRNWKEITFTAKKPTILTNIPASSYTLTTDGNKNYTLTITNPSDFWRLTSYLIIQTN